MKKAILIPLGILCLFYSCKTKATHAYVNLDSVDEVKKSDSLSKKLNAFDFDNYSENKYSIQFDSLLNKRVFLSSYVIGDIKGDSSNFLITLRHRRKYIINIKADNSDMPLVKKIMNGDRPPLVFYLTDIKRANITSSDVLFYANASFNDAVVLDSTAIDYTQLPYKDRIYFALRENVKGFDTSKRDFYAKLKDKKYDLKVYAALKDNLQGFNKSQQEFISLVNE